MSDKKTKDKLKKSIKTNELAWSLIGVGGVLALLGGVRLIIYVFFERLSSTKQLFVSDFFASIVGLVLLSIGLLIHTLNDRKD